MSFDAGAAIGRLELNIAGWQKSVESVKKDQQSLSGLVMRHEQQFKSLGKTLTVVGGLVVASLGAMIKKTADYGDEMDEMHQRTGASVELLTGLDGTLKKNGASAQDLAVGMKFLSGKMVDANSGNKEAIALFKGLGISVTDANGNLRSTTDVLFDVATRFSGMEDGAVKTTAAVDLLGKGGMSLIPTLNLGADGLRREAEEAGRLGKVLTVETAKACSDFNDSLVDLKGGLQGVGIQIGQALMPAVKGLVEKITSIVIKVREWAAEHPELASGLSKVALGLGALMMTIGPVLYALPGLIKGLTALKAIAAGPIAIIVTVGIITAIKAMSDFKSEFNNMRDAMKESGSSGFEAFLEGVNSGIRKVALGMKDSNIVLSEANALARLYATEGGRGMKDVLLEEKGAIDGLNPALSALAALFKELGVKTKTELTEELKKAEEALRLLKDSAEATPGAVKALEDQIAKLKEQITGVTVETRSLAEQLGITFRSDIEAQIKKLNEALVTYRGKLTADEIQRICTEINTLQGRLTALKGPVIDLGKAFDTVMSSMDNLPATAEEVADAMSKEFEDLRNQMQADFEKLAMKDLPAHLQNIPAASEDAADKTKSVWQECSTVIADSMRDIASEIAGLFNFKGFFGAMPETPKFDSSYYDDMVKAADSAYDKITDASRRAFDVQELQISRAEEDADRRRSRQEDKEDKRYADKYERDKKAIENSKMTEVQKEAALNALERKYETAKLAREIARENAKVALERAREDAKYKREEAQAAKLLALQWKHETDLNAIRIAEDTARQKQADDELKRQDSLWFKVKGIFATACENMTTIFLTTMFKPIGDLIKKLAEKLVGKGTDAVAGALDGTGEHVKGLGTTIGEFISGIGTGIGGFISGLATGIGAAIISISTAIASAMVALATGIASAATIIAAAAPAIIVTSLLALGIVAGLNLLKRIFSSGSSGAGDGMGRVVERQDIQISLLTRIFDTLNDNIKTALWAISTKLDKGVKDRLGTIGGYLKTIASSHYLKDVVGYLKSIDKKIGEIGFASGGIAWAPQMAMVAERKPEIIGNLDDYLAGRPLAGIPQSGGGGGQGPINLTIPFYLDGTKLDERMLRIANGRVEWLHGQYKRSNYMIPPRTIGGVG